MAREKRKQSEANIYHIINRGAGRQIIFEDDEDYRFFLKLLEKSLIGQSIELLCWCLMSNHFHLLLKGDILGISTAMRITCCTYAKYFNARHGRTGHLFQERFRSEPITDDPYLITVVRYIHQNPLLAGLSRSCEYKWSSYNWYTQSHAPVSCSTEIVLEIFGGIEEFKRLHQEICKKGTCLEYFSERTTLSMPESKVIDVAEKALGVGAVEELKAWDKGKRNAALRSLFFAGLSVRQIERLTGVGRSTISRVVHE